MHTYVHTSAVSFILVRSMAEISSGEKVFFSPLATLTSTLGLPSLVVTADKMRQDQTRSDKIRQDQTRPDKIRQDQTRSGTK